MSPSTVSRPGDRGEVPPEQVVSDATVPVKVAPVEFTVPPQAMSSVSPTCRSSFGRRTRIGSRPSWRAIGDGAAAGIKVVGDGEAAEVERAGGGRGQTEGVAVATCSRA